MWSLFCGSDRLDCPAGWWISGVCHSCCAHEHKGCKECLNDFHRGVRRQLNLRPPRKDCQLSTMTVSERLSLWESEQSCDWQTKYLARDNHKHGTQGLDPKALSDRCRPENCRQEGRDADITITDFLSVCASCKCGQCHPLLVLPVNDSMWECSPSIVAGNFSCCHM